MHIRSLGIRLIHRVTPGSSHPVNQVLLLVSLLSILSVSSPAQNNLFGVQEVPILSLDNLVQGRIYAPDYYPVRNTQYLEEAWTEGNVRILENEYRGLLFRYDIFADELILLHRGDDSGLNKIQLTKAYVQYFTLGSRYFINLDYSRYRESGLKSKYYELIYENEISLLAERNMELETIDAITYFTQKDSWHLIKDGKAYRIRTKKNLWEAFGKENKKQINTFLKQQRIVVKRIESAEWLKLAVYLNSL